jgi:hypothetical protein
LKTTAVPSQALLIVFNCTAKMSLSYGFGGATAALGVVGACKFWNLSCIDYLELTSARYAIHWRWRSIQCTPRKLEEWRENTDKMDRSVNSSKKYRHTLGQAWASACA